MVFPAYPFRPYTQGFDLGFQWQPTVTGRPLRIKPHSHTHLIIKPLIANSGGNIMDRFNAGEAIVLTARMYSVDIDGVEGVLTTPSTSYTITITDPNGTPVLTDAPMLLSSVGRFYYNLPTTESDVLGVYDVLIKAVDDSLETRQRYSYHLGR